MLLVIYLFIIILALPGFEFLWLKITHLWNVGMVIIYVKFNYSYSTNSDHEQMGDDDLYPFSCVRHLRLLCYLDSPVYISCQEHEKTL